MLESSPDEVWGGMKRVAERKPIVAIAVIADPVQVGLAPGVVPPDVACLLIALERYT